MSKSSKTNKKVKVKLIKSLIGRLKNHQQCARGLGLRKIRDEIVVIASPENMGMINTINYMLEVSEEA